MLLLFLLTDETANNQTITIATLVIAVATVLYFITTVLLWLTTKHAFEASHRPFIGVTAVKREVLNDPLRFMFTIHIQNAGTVPANDVTNSLRIVADGIILPAAVIKEEEETAIVIPGSTQGIIETVDDPKHCQTIENATNLSLLFKCTYKGVGKKEYLYEQKISYNKVRNTFGAVKGIAT